MSIEFDLPIKSGVEASVIRKALFCLFAERGRDLDEYKTTATRNQVKRWKMQRGKCGDLLARVDKQLKLAQLANSAVVEDEEG